MEKYAMKCIQLHDQRPKIKSIFIEHLHVAYHCKNQIAEFLQQIEEKAELAELKQLITSYTRVTQKELTCISRLYETLDIAPGEPNITAFKTYCLEALIAILKQYKDLFKRELTMLNHLYAIAAADNHNVKQLYRLSKPLEVGKSELLSMMLGSNVVLKSFERITQHLI